MLKQTRGGKSKKRKRQKKMDFIGGRKGAMLLFNNFEPDLKLESFF